MRVEDDWDLVGGHDGWGCVVTRHGNCTAIWCSTVWLAAHRRRALLVASVGPNHCRAPSRRRQSSSMRKWRDGFPSGSRCISLAGRILGPKTCFRRCAERRSCRSRTKNRTRRAGVPRPRRYRASCSLTIGLPKPSIANVQSIS